MRRVLSRHLAAEKPQPKKEGKQVLTEAKQQFHPLLAERRWARALRAGGRSAGRHPRGGTCGPRMHQRGGDKVWLQTGRCPRAGPALDPAWPAQAVQGRAAGLRSHAPVPRFPAPPHPRRRLPRPQGPDRLARHLRAALQPRSRAARPHSPVAPDAHAAPPVPGLGAPRPGPAGWALGPPVRPAPGRCRHTGQGQRCSTWAPAPTCRARRGRTPAPRACLPWGRAGRGSPFKGAA